MFKLREVTVGLNKNKIDQVFDKVFFCKEKIVARGKATDNKIEEKVNTENKLAKKPMKTQEHTIASTGSTDMLTIKHVKKVRKKS